MKQVVILIAFLLPFSGISQISDRGHSIAFKAYKSQHPEKELNFAVKGSESDIKGTNGIHYKYQNNGWHFIRCSSQKVSQMMEDGLVKQIYFSPSQPKMLNDTLRIVQNVDSVLNGESPLPAAYTGKDVIIGYVDTGLDWNHPDFQNADGSTRVLYYWDQTLPFDIVMTPGKYGYGQVWDSTQINLGTCTSMDDNAHGTTVTGTGSGNGLATGTHKGVAPESDIIIVETNFSDPNWTLTVADGIDFVLSMADTLGKPAVVNTSIGDYLGSHDGTDPAGHIVDSLLNDMPGRIVVAAAGNSGAIGPYHVGALVDADTSFTWFDVNPTPNHVYFDLWSDTLDFQNVSFAVGADNDAPFDFRGRTNFYNIDTMLDVTSYDSIMNGGNKLADVEFYCEEINGVYHIECLVDQPDSNAYLYRFETFGSGSYDLWSDAALGMSEIVSSGLPTIGAFPDIEFYHLPDTLQTIVSSWTCLPSVVTVGNFQSKWQFTSIDLVQQWSLVPFGQLSIASSKGPNRAGVTKPDVCASGDGTLSACPLWLAPSMIASNPEKMAIGGMHVINGGTSMAAPVIAGIAALYLEKCPTATYEDFRDDLQLNASPDAFTGPVPNNAYGYGKVDAFQLLTNTNHSPTVVGDSILCSDPNTYSAAPGPFTSYLWHTGETTSTIDISMEDTVSVTLTNQQGCIGYSDSLIVIQGEIPDFPFINELGGGLITTPADSFLWYIDGGAIMGTNSQYYDPDTTGT